MFDIISVGGATIDVFVKTKNPEIVVHKKHKDVCYNIGSKILIDELHIKTGGGATNTAVSFSRLGLKTGFLGVLGKDYHSKLVKEELTKEKISFLGNTQEGQLGYSVIFIGLGKDRTILTYKGLTNKLIVWKPVKTKWLYISSVLGKGFTTTKKIINWAKNNNIQWAFNPSLYLAQQGLKKLKPLLDGCSVLVLNKEEAKALTKQKKLLNMLQSLHYFANFVVITDGPRDVHAYDGKTCFILTPLATKILETTGAGDAFASGVVAGIILKKDPVYALQLGFVQASGVLQSIGAKEKLYTRKEAELIMRTKKCKLDKNLKTS
ncbi:carbohydrate kinase family protein [Candidatus Woesearchaeota archaeon]|nr:carbohydrate kinase family protein [Candidatus Woesearchaeota archaeon]